MRPRNSPYLYAGLGIGALLLLAAFSGAAAGAPATPSPPAGSYEPWVWTLLRKTSAHEGRFWSVNPNLDGNGVSWGILQWTQRSGSLGRLLGRLARTDPDAFRRTFGPSWATVLDVTARASLEPVDGVVLWREPWLSRWRAAGHHPAFQAAQVHEAVQSDYFSSAVEIARLLGVQSERALVMYFNRTVHQGPGTALTIAKTLASWYQDHPHARPIRPDSVLAEYAWLCAKRFRRAAPPASPKLGTATWKPVTTELELTNGAQGSGAWMERRISAPGVWHAVTGPWDLYDLIIHRSAQILSDPELGDLPVRLPARVA